MVDEPDPASKPHHARTTYQPGQPWRPRGATLRYASSPGNPLRARPGEESAEGAGGSMTTAARDAYGAPPDRGDARAESTPRPAESAAAGRGVVQTSPPTTDEAKRFMASNHFTLSDASGISAQGSVNRVWNWVSSSVFWMNIVSQVSSSWSAA